MHKRYTISIKDAKGMPQKASPLAIRTHIQLELEKPLAAIMRKAKFATTGSGHWTLKILPGCGAEMEYLSFKSGEFQKKKITIWA